MEPFVPNGWKAYKDQKTQRYYYVSDTTGESTWVLPEEAIRSHTAQQQLSSSQGKNENANNTSYLPPGWMSYLDPKSGRPYYVGPDGKSTWNAPIVDFRNNNGVQVHSTEDSQSTATSTISDSERTQNMPSEHKVAPPRPKPRRSINLSKQNDQFTTSATNETKRDGSSSIPIGTPDHTEKNDSNIEPSFGRKRDQIREPRVIYKPKGPSAPTVSSKPKWHLPTHSDELKLLPLGGTKEEVDKVGEQLKAMVAIGVPKKSPKHNKSGAPARRLSEQIEIAAKGKHAFVKATSTVNLKQFNQTTRNSYRRKSVSTAQTMEMISSNSEVRAMQEPSKVIRKEYVVKDHVELGGYASLSIWRGQSSNGTTLTDLRQDVLGGNDYLVFDKVWKCMLRANFNTGGFLLRGGITLYSGDGSVKLAMLNKATFLAHVHNVFYVSVPSLARDGTDSVFATIKSVGLNNHHWNIYSGKGSAPADCLYQLSAWDRYAHLRARDPVSYSTGELSFSQLVMEYRRGEPVHIAAGMDLIIAFCCFVVADSFCKWDLSPDLTAREQVMARAKLSV